MALAPPSGALNAMVGPPPPTRLGETWRIKETLPEDWWKGFFGADYLLMYGAELTPELSAREVDCAVRCLDLREGQRALDVCCGFARHLPWLLKRGLRAVGIESSPYQVRFARQASSSPDDLPLLRGDARLMPFDGGFDAVLCLYTSMGYFSDADNARQIAEMARALRPGGGLYIDNQNPDYILAHLRPERETRDARSGITVVELFDYDEAEKRIYGRKTIQSPTSVSAHDFFMRLYRPDEMRALLEGAGLRVREFYGDYDRSPWTSGAPRLIVTATKEG